MPAIASGGGGGRPITIRPPRPRSSPVSRGVAAVVAPVQHAAHTVARAPVMHAPPPRSPVSRGVSAVVAPVQHTSHAIAHAVAPAHHAAPTSHLGTSIGGHGGLGPIAAVVSHPNVSLASLLKPAGGVLGHLGQDVIDFPRSTIQGTAALGAAAAHDIVHPTHTPTLLHLASEMAGNDALVQALTGHFAKAGHLAATHPLGAILDVAGGAGAAGRVLGAAGRAGGLGAASLERAPRDLLNLPDSVKPALRKATAEMAPVERRASPNLFAALIQRGLDAKLPGIHPKLDRAAFEHEMRVRANEHQMLRQDLEARYEAAARTAGGGHATGQQIRRARGRARQQAMGDLLQQNAVRNRRTGDIFFGKSTTPRAIDQLAEHGHDFVKVKTSELFRKRDNRGQVVIPRSLYDQLKAHEAASAPPATVAAAGVQQLQRQFRNSVLPFSTKWIAGNTIEALLRSGLEGVGPQHHALFNRLIDEMRAEGLGDHADRLEAQGLQGTHFSLNARLDRELRQREHQGKTPLTRAGYGVAHKYNAGIDAIFRGNALLERQFAKGVLGKHMAQTIRRLKAAHPDLTPEELLARTAHHYSRPEVAAEAGRYSRQVLGKYSGFGPSGRQFVRYAAPFSPWYANAAKFMATLPGRHPLYAGAAYHAARATDKQWDAQHKSIKGLGGSLLAMPTLGTPPKGGFSGVDIGRYMPMGAFSAGTGLPLGKAAVADILPAIAPQWQSLFLNLEGLDPFGSALQYPGPASKLTPTGRVSHAKSHYAQTGAKGADPTVAFSNFLGGLLGPANAAHRIVVDRGRKVYNTEKLWDVNPQTKSGAVPLDLHSILQGLDKVLNPVRPTVVAPHSTSSKSKKGGGRSNSIYGAPAGGHSGKSAPSIFGAARPTFSKPGGQSSDIRDYKKLSAEDRLRLDLQNALANFIHQLDARKPPPSGIVEAPGGGFALRHAPYDTVPPRPAMSNTTSGPLGLTEVLRGRRKHAMQRRRGVHAEPAYVNRVRA